MTTKLHQYTINAQGGISGTSWIDVPAGGSGAWGAISGTLSAQTDLQTALNGKQASGSYAASSHGHAIVDVTGLQTALDGKQVAGTYATGSGSASGSNTGDNATNSQYSALVSNATHTGDATGSVALTVVKINGVLMSSLATGILKNTTTTGAPSIATGADLPAMSATVGGAVPTPPNNTTTFLRGDGTFAAPTASVAWGGITGTLSNQTDLQTALNGKQASGTYATGSGTASGTNTGDGAANSSVHFIGTTSVALNRASAALVMTGITSIDGTAVNLSGTPTLPTGTLAATPAAADNTTKIATSAYAMSAAPNASYRTLLDSSGSHSATKVAGTYGMGQGDILAVTGIGTLYPLNTIAIASTDYPTVNGLAPKLRIRCNINCNDVAPFVGTFIIGLHPVTRPATSGGAGLCIYTIGTAVAGSTVTGTNLIADSANLLAGADFAIPANGQYVIAVVTNATVAASAHVHLSGSLQLRNA